MKRSKQPRPRKHRSLEFDAAVQVAVNDIDWDSPVDVDLDPKLIERIRARKKLKQITLRLGEEQITEARRVAAETGVAYQVVLRRWLAEGASLSRSLREDAG